MQEKNGILRSMGGRLAPPTAAQRSWRLALVALLLLPQTVIPATITVDEVGCNLDDAIIAANTDTATGGCTAGDPGADTLDLTAGVSRTATYSGFGYTAFPYVSSEITIDANGNTIERTGGPDFRLFYIVPSGTLTINDATLSGGSRTGDLGGALYNYYGTLALNNSTVSGNYGYFGAIAARGGTTTLTDSTISGNTAYFNPALYSYFGANVDITSSTISGNTGTVFGGLVLGSTTTNITNSTISGNYGTFGGPFVLRNYSYTYLSNSTVSANTAPNYFGALYNQGGTAYLTNTVVSGNTSGIADCPPFGIVDLGGNFSEDASCPGAAITTGVDIDGTLADNGGPTMTHALLDGSAALDVAACGLLFDQRGEPRDDGLCDSGSFELQQTVVTCEQSLRDLATYILGEDLSRFVGMSAARRSILASRAIGAANAMKFCSESTALIRLDSLIMLVDGIGRDYMTDSPNEITDMAQILYDTIEAGECPECAP